MHRHLHFLPLACIWLLWLMPQTMMAQLVADFTFSPASPICAQTQVSFTDQSTGSPTSWSWDFGTGNTSTGPNPTTFFWQQGTYTVTLTISDGVNTATSSQTIVVNSPQFDYSLYELTPNFSNCGPVNATLTYSGTLSGTWTWDMGDGTTYPGNLYTLTHTYASNTYATNTLTITDGGCTQTFWLDSVFVGNGLCLNAAVTNVSCNPPTLGAIDLSPSGGTAPYTFSWSNGATTEDLSGLTEGIYTVVITDASGQSTTESFTIDNSLIDLDFLVDDTDCSGTGGSLDLTISGGTAPYTIAWSNGATGTTSLTNLNAGGYSVTVTDANGCTDHDPIFVGYDDSCRINVSGRIYLDNNQNCVYDPATDVVVNGWVTALNVGSSYSSSGASGGQYAFNLPAGPVDLTMPWQQSWYGGINSNYYNLICPVGNLHSLPFQSTDTTGLDFAFQADTVVHDLKITQVLGTVRPGFNHSHSLYVKNVGTQTSVPTVTWVHDPLTDFVSATPPATSYDPLTRTATWVLPSMGPLQQQVIQISGYTDPTVPLGTIVTYDASIVGDPSETALQDNSETDQTIVTGSYDPNDKQVQPMGQGRAGAVDESTEWFTYRIRFQNTGTDTAFYVAIRDTLDQNFEFGSVEALGSSHPYRFTMGKAGEMEFFYDWILLPDSGTNLEASQGYIDYRVRRRDGLPLGTQLSNTAAIYFDFNAPVITNTTVSTLVRAVTVISPSTLGLRIYPNPSHGVVWVETDHTAINALTLTNTAGQTLLSREGQGLTRASLDLQQLPVGLYLLQVQTNQGRSVHKLLIEE